MKRYEFLDHTADIIVRAYGENLEEAYAAVADAFFAITTNKSVISKNQELHFDCESIDDEGLLVKFLSELIIMYEVQNLVLTDFTVTFDGPHMLKAHAWGESFDRKRHGHGVVVKGASYHMIEIHRASNTSEAWLQVLLDI